MNIKDENEATNRLAAERQVQKFGLFLEEYAEDLIDIKSRLDGQSEPSIIPQHGREQLTLIELSHSDNKTISKVALALVTLIEEMKKLEEEGERSLVSPLLVYGEGEDLSKDQNGCLMIGRMLSHFQHLACYVDHCKDVVSNLLLQMSVLLGSKSPIKLGPVRLMVVWETLANLLRVLSMLDVAVNTPLIQQHWASYKRMVKGLRHEPEKYGSDVDSVRKLENILLDLEKKILSGNMLSTVTSLSLDGGKGMYDEIGASARNLIAEVESQPLTGGDKFVAACCLTALLQQITKQQDRKIATKLWEVVKKIPGCSVAFSNGVTWIPEDFFSHYLPQSPEGQTPQEKKLIVSIETSRKSWLGSCLNTLGVEVKALKTNVSNWIVNMTVKIPRSQENMQIGYLFERAELLLIGISWLIGRRTP